MYYLRRMVLKSRRPSADDPAVWEHVEAQAFVFWTYRNLTPNILIAESREHAKQMILHLNPDADFFR
jgi:hypothetical protein